MSDEEIRKMFCLIKRYVDTETDQWDAFKFRGSGGMVFVHFLRSVPDGHGGHIDIDHLLTDCPW